ncbi:MAG: SCP2 sterol-binding domain-containing protein [Actinobacteria bacterium]|nr:SCP2 sterol-binding domain-containing protein [Actinomycetota bacterium]
MPKDETRFVVTVANGAPTVTLVEPGDTPPLVFTATAADAEAVRSGALNLNVGFMQGRVKTAGDMRQALDLLRSAR